MIFIVFICDTFHFIRHSLKNHMLNIQKNIDLLHAFSFYDKLSIKKYQKHLKDMQEVTELK